MAHEDMKDSLMSLESALDRLREALALPIDAHPIALDGTIQRFEFCYELVWKTVQRFARSVGLDPRSPRDAFRVAYGQGWIEDEDLWLSMLRDRNLTSHTYKIELALEIYGRIRSYYTEMKRIAGLLKKQV